MILITVLLYIYSLQLTCFSYTIYVFLIVLNEKNNLFPYFFLINQLNKVVNVTKKNTCLMDKPIYKLYLLNLVKLTE